MLLLTFLVGLALVAGASQPAVHWPPRNWKEKLGNAMHAVCAIYLWGAAVWAGLQSEVVFAGLMAAAALAFTGWTARKLQAPSAPASGTSVGQT